MSFTTPITDREQQLIAALRAIVTETMCYPPQAPISDDSYIPADLVRLGQSALCRYGRQVYTARQQERIAQNIADPAQRESHDLDRALLSMVSAPAPLGDV
jgi:hypothetical protein